MSLLNVTVVRGKISAGNDQLQQKPEPNTFLVLKLENVKSSTLPLKGVDPAWEEEFLFETSKITGVDLLVELWQKGLIWDNVIGYKLIQVDQLFQGQLAEPGVGNYLSAPAKFHVKRWFTLDADLLVAGVDQPTILGTKNATQYMVFLDLRWELTNYDPMSTLTTGLRPTDGSSQLYGPSVDNYNNHDAYDSEMRYGNGEVYVGGQQCNNSEMYSRAAYNGLDEDALYNCPELGTADGDYDGGYLTRNPYAGSGSGDYDGYLSRESTFQDNNCSFYDNAFQQQPSSCDMTKRPKLLPQVPATTSSIPAVNLQQLDPTYIKENESAGCSFEVFGAFQDPYSTYCYNEYNETDWATTSSSNRRKVLPSAPIPAPQYDEFDLSYNSQPPTKLEDKYYDDGLYEYGVNSGFEMNHVDQLNWKNLSQGPYYDGGDTYCTPPLRSSSKRKVLPQIPVQNKSSATKSLPATPASSVLGINCKNRRLPQPVPNPGIPTSTTLTGFSKEHVRDRPQYVSTHSADSADVSADMFNTGTATGQQWNTPTMTNLGSRSTSKPSLLADMKSLFSGSSGLFSTTLNNVSSSLSANLPTSSTLQPNNTPFSSFGAPTEAEDNFIKTNKFEEQSPIIHQNSLGLQDYPSMCYDDAENQLNNNFNSGGDDQSTYDYHNYNQEVGYDESMTSTKFLPSVPVQQVPFVISTTASSSTSQARNFFVSKNNTTFHSTVENISEEDPPSSTAVINPSNIMKMSTNNSYELEEEKSLYGSSFHTDIDEYDLIANGDIKQNFTYTEKNLMVTPSTMVAETTGSANLKNDARSIHGVFMDNDTMNNNSSTRPSVFGGNKDGGSDYGGDDYSFTGNISSSAKGHDYGTNLYDQQADLYYEDHSRNNEDQYFEQRREPTAMGQDTNATEYYYSQVELGTGVSNLEGIEELDEYERDDKEDEEHSPHDYNYYINYNKKGSLKSGDHHFIEEEEEEEAGDAVAVTSEDNKSGFELSEFGHADEEIRGDRLSKQWTASDDEIIDRGVVKKDTSTTTVPTSTISVISEAIVPNPMSGISALMTSMSPAVVTQSGLSPGSMLAAGITTTLAANISNTITTTITGSPSIIFDAGAGDIDQAPSTISKAIGSLIADESAPKMTAKQRWHHAYNKIILQLNVSTKISE